MNYFRTNDHHQGNRDRFIQRPKPQISLAEIQSYVVHEGIDSIPHQEIENGFQI